MMADKNVEVDFRFDELELILDRATPDMLDALAFKIEEAAKLRMDQVDTGFAVNTIQALPTGSSGISGYTEDRIDRDGRDVVREAGDLPAMAKDEAGVGIGAAYGAILEARKPFLYPAAEDVGAQAGATVSAVARRHGLG
jgi:hypothetical protein